MEKKKTTAMIISVLLIVVAMIIGIFIGFLIGRSDDGPSDGESDEAIGTADTQAQIESQPSAESGSISESAETVPETAGAQAENLVTVLTVGDHQVLMDEVNVRLYMLRSHYIESYGEEPWEEIMDDGRTVSETAKDELESDIVRAEIYMDKAADYGIEVTDAIREMCAQEAETFIQNLGPEVTEEFGLRQDAVESVYVKYQIITAVTNAIGDEVRGEMEAAGESVGEDELNTEITERILQKENEWKSEYTVSYSEIWEHIVVGSVG